ncbi:hypothetical protein DE146DRAFT_736001 [Phaeosphaeria sp. MPI-PUGE-AT-0046c]|nr:hypothetical protein DE146DRAFT_736001 [Phaeosphaeria sp. MPI-PUGE-AT-0046c]
MLAYSATQKYDSRSESGPQPKCPTKFMFIDSSHGGVNAKPDKNVRSFVMKSARTKKTWSTRPKSPKKDPSSDTRAKREPSIQTRRPFGSDATLPRSAYSDSIVSCSNSDFHNFSERALTDRAVIVSAAPRVIPIDPHKSAGDLAMQWIKGCIQSPVGAPFIYAVLTSSARAAHLDSEKYKWRAMSAVNGLLSNPRTSTNDCTISAVLVLLAIEEADLADPRRQGDERECSLMVNDAHHNGLRTMIRQRGGLAALSGNRVLQVCLLMHSTAQAITTYKDPYAVLVDTNGQIEDYAIITNQSPSDYAHILRHFRMLNLDRSLLKIVFAITIFVADLTKWYETGICAVDALDLQKHASLLMYRLFKWYRQSEEDSTSFHWHMTAVNQSVCLALLIFMVNATEPTAGPLGSRLSKTVARLCQSLGTAPLQLWSNAPNILLWVSTMGALGAGSLPKAHQASAHESSLAFFEKYTRSACIGEVLDHNTPADHLLDKMRSCLWIPSVFDQRAKMLWASMGLCGSFLAQLDDVSSSEGEQVEDEHALGQSTTLRFFSTDTKPT